MAVEAAVRRSVHTAGGSGDGHAAWVMRIVVRPVTGSERHPVPRPPSQP